MFIYLKAYVSDIEVKICVKNYIFPVNTITADPISGDKLIIMFGGEKIKSRFRLVGR